MNILFIVPYVPNLIRVRPYNLISALQKRGNRVTVMTIWTNEQERKEAEDLKQNGFEVDGISIPRSRSMVNSLLALPSRTPLQAVYSWSPELAHKITSRLVGKDGKFAFDVAHVEHLRGSRYGLYLNGLSLSGMPRLPVVWDSVDCITLLFRQASARSKSFFGRWLTRFDLGRTENYEGWLLGQFRQVLVTSPADKAALLSLNKDASKSPCIHVLPNGVDLETFAPDPAVQRAPAELVISGKMSYHANVTMTLNLVQNIMPLVWERRPDVKLTVVGKDPPNEIRALAQNPAIHVTGTVKELQLYLQRATIAVVPITYGVGIQNKVLEAMACATPVVSSPQAVSSLEIRAGKDLLVAPDAPAFAAAILELLQDPQRREVVGQAGRGYVEVHHRWSNIAAQLETIYAESAREMR